MARSASLGELITKMSVPYFMILTFRSSSVSSCYDSSRHIGESHWLTQPSDNKIVFLGVVFHLEAKIIKFKVGYGVCLCQCAKAFPGNIIVLLRPF